MGTKKATQRAKNRVRKTVINTAAEIPSRKFLPLPMTIDGPKTIKIVTTKALKEDTLTVTMEIDTRA